MVFPQFLLLFFFSYEKLLTFTLRRWKIKLNLNLKFIHLLCSLLTLDREDSLRSHRSDISDTVRKNKITKEGAIEGYDKTKQNENELYTAIQNGEGWMLCGYLDIARVPEIFTFPFIKPRRPDLARKDNMAHQFYLLVLGIRNQNYIYYIKLILYTFVDENRNNEIWIFSCYDEGHNSKKRLPSFSEACLHYCWWNFWSVFNFE